MSGKITTEDGIEYVDSGYTPHRVHKYKGTTWYGEPRLARVPAGRRNSPRNAVADPTGGVMFGLNYRRPVFRDLPNGEREFTDSYYDDTLVLHMDREEAINLARYLLEAATGRHM